MMKTFEKGHYACLKFELRAHEKGFSVSKPTLAESRYDYILDDGSRLWRVQVKYAGGKSSNSSGAATCNLTRQGHRRLGSYSACDVDVVVAYLPQVDKLAWILPEKFEGKSLINIRYEAPRNGQQSGVTHIGECEW